MPEPTNREACNVLVKLGGKEQVKATATKNYNLANGMNIVSLTIDQRLDAPDSFEAEFLGVDEGELVVFDWAKEGTTVEAGFSYDSPVPTMFNGEVVYVESNFDVRDGNTVKLMGYDRIHRLTRGHDAQTWGGKDNKQDKSMPDGVKTRLTEHGLTASGDKSDLKFNYIPKAMATDYDFIKWAGYNIARQTSPGSADEATVKFRTPELTTNSVAQICRENQEGDNPVPVISARFQLSTFPAYQKVRVRGWDSLKKEAFVKEITACSHEVDGSSANKGWEKGWEIAKSAHGGKDAIYECVVDWVEHQDAAQKLAQGIFDSFSLRYLTGEVTCLGAPAIVPGATVEFKGFGQRVEGKVIVTQVTHHMSANGEHPYTSTFQFCSSAAGKAL